MRKLNGKQMMIQYISSRSDYSRIDKKIENLFEHQFIKIKSNFIENSRPYQIYFHLHQHWQNPRTISAFWIIDEIPKATRKASTSFIHKLQHHNWLSSRSLNSSSFFISNIRPHLQPSEPQPHEMKLWKIDRHFVFRNAPEQEQLSRDSGASESTTVHKSVNVKCRHKSFLKIPKQFVAWNVAKNIQ